MNLVKIGALYLNCDQITEVRDTGVDIEVFFCCSNRATTLKGADAQALRLWLDSVARDLEPATSHE